MFFSGKRKLDEQEDRAESSDVNKKTKGASTHNILNRSPQDVYQEFQPFSFFLTKVADIPQKFNTQGAMSLKGNL